ncbi:MAG TPA: efflux RND transporter periplasmic adaptor subunit [Pirellulales bacterium]|nr:efflux RND transporter periplasmic adaptor subunit [Pirellulales bacterium]
MKWMLTVIVAAVASSLATWAIMRQQDWGQPTSPKTIAPHETGRETPESVGACAPSTGPNVAALARLEPENGVISINGTPGDRLDDLKVHLGEQVHEGQELAILESRTLRQGELELAETQLAEARARKIAEEAYADAALGEADLAEEQAQLQKLDQEAHQKKVAGLMAAYRSSQDDLERLKLVRHSQNAAPGEHIVSDQQLAHQELATNKARNELEAAIDESKKLQESIDLAYRQARAKRKTAEANRARIPSLVLIDSLEKQVELARRRVELTTLKAPSDGEIVRIFLNDGDTLTQQPILQMADISRMVAVVEVYEDDVRHIRVDAEACVDSKALASPLSGKVTYIGNMVAKNSVVGLDPTASTDRRVVEARILLRPSASTRALINLQVTAHIPIDGKAETAPAAAEAPPAAPAQTTSLETRDRE